MSDQSAMNLRYNEQKGPLFGLTLKTGLLTLVTLGIYRFWQKTRIRKYIWSSVSADGDAFEYTGTGLEKFLGFLVAIVFLAVYLGLLQMGLFFLGLNILVDPETATTGQLARQNAAFGISSLAVLPFIFFAMYRARRYKMARTRFRGIRLGMEKGAWGYVWRAMAYYALATITLGILTPLATFRLEKYMTDRSYYGSTPLRQEGRWQDLYAAMKHIAIALLIIIAGGALTAYSAMNEAIGSGILGGLMIFVGYIWLMIGAVYYQVHSFGYLMTHKRLGHPGGDDIGFVAEPRAKSVIKTYILGSLLLSLLSSVVFGIAFAIAMPFLGNMEDLITETARPSLSSIIAFGIVIGAGYMIGLVVMQALTMILITQPILAHYVGTITVTNPEGLNRVTQREAETGLDADGFADALDIGGAI